jgi:hypothetical protein
VPPHALFVNGCPVGLTRHVQVAGLMPPSHGRLRGGCRRGLTVTRAGRVFASIEEAQAELDAWVEHYNAERPHQGIGMVAPLRRFELAAKAPEPVATLEGAAEEPGPELRPLTRLVSGSGKISFEAASFHVGAWLAGEAVELTLRDGLLEIAHRGVLVACHVLASGPSVARKVDPTGYVSFAGQGYFVSNRLRGQQVEVRLAAGTVQISQRGVLLKTHVARQDRAKEHGAFSTPQGRPHRTNASRFSREEGGTDQPEPNWNAGGGT